MADKTYDGAEDYGQGGYCVDVGFLWQPKEGGKVYYCAAVFYGRSWVCGLRGDGPIEPLVGDEGDFAARPDWHEHSVFFDGVEVPSAVWLQVINKIPERFEVAAHRFIPEQGEATDAESVSQDDVRALCLAMSVGVINGEALFGFSPGTYHLYTITRPVHLCERARQRRGNELRWGPGKSDLRDEKKGGG